MNAAPIQTNFTAGEISPLLYGRTDISKYFNGVREITNFIVKPQGGAVRRSGTRFVHEVKTSSKKTILIRFEFSVVQAYILEFGDQYIRFYRNEGIIESSPGTPYEISTPYLEADLENLYVTQSADILYIAHPSYAPRKLSRTAHTSWTLSTLSNEDGPYLDENTSVVSLNLETIVDSATLKSTTNDFVAGDVNKYVEFYYKGNLVLGKILTYVGAKEVTVAIQDNTIIQSSIDPSAEILSVAGEAPPKVDPTAVMSYAAAAAPAPNRIRASVTTWSSQSENCFIKVGGVWYKTGAHAAQTETVAVTWGNNYSADVIEIASTPTMLASFGSTGVLTVSNRTITAVLKASASTFASSDVGRQVRLNFLSEQVAATITAYTSATQVSVTLNRMMPFDRKKPDTYLGNAITSIWKFGAWYTGNYPSVVTFHEERLVFANTSLQPQTLWFSVSGDYENFAPTDNQSKVLDDSAMTYTIASGKINAIVWLASGPVLLVGTAGAESQIKPSSLNESLTPTNIQITQQTDKGSLSTCRPERVGSSLLFIQRQGRKLIEMTYEFQIDAHVSEDITVLSEHILRRHGAGKFISYQGEPNSILWISTEDGPLIGVTYEKKQEVIAWHKHVIGGTGVYVESIACIPSEDLKYTTLWMVVKRTINGSTKRYVEFMEKEFDPETPDDKDQMFFVDSGLSYDGSPTNTVTGLAHLEGETVQVVADGAVRPDCVVDSGSITFQGQPAEIVHVGLKQGAGGATIRTLPVDAGSDYGTAQGKMKRIEKLVIRFKDTLGISYGENPANLNNLSFRATNDPMGVTPPLFSGDKQILFSGTYTLLPDYYIRQEQPYPATILALMPKLVTYT